MFQSERIKAYLKGISGDTCEKYEQIKHILLIAVTL